MNGFSHNEIDNESAISKTLQDRLVGVLDLGLVLKHVHWNVTGPTFQGIHEHLDDQVESVRKMVDEIAERIATLGGEPNGLAGNLVDNRSWADYPLMRASVEAHLQELDQAYTGVIDDHRKAIESVGSADPVTEDLLIGQTSQLELYQWFIRSNLGVGID